MSVFIFGFVAYTFNSNDRMAASSGAQQTESPMAISATFRPQEAPRSLGMSMLVLAFAHLILAIDFTIVYVALPELGTQLHFSSHTLQWVIHGYTVAFGGCLLLGGRASDLLGRRRVFTLALVAFGAASLLGGIASGGATMVFARAPQGIGAAFVFPSTLALINTLFDEGAPRVRALAIWSLFGSSGLALGSLLGGLLVAFFGWRSVFLVNAPLAFVTAGAARFVMPADRAAFGKRRFDLAGAISVTLSSTLLVVALVEGPACGWGSSEVSVLFAAALVSLGVFSLIELRGADPLLPIRMLRSRNLRVAMALTALFMGTFMALPYFETILFQQSFNYGPLRTGLAFLLPCLAQAAGTQIGARFTRGFGMRKTVVAGFTIGAVGTASLAVGMGPGDGYAALVPGLLVAGVGQGVAWGPIWIAVASGVKASEHGVANAIASTTFQIGGALGLAALVGLSAMAVATPESSELVRAGARLAAYGATLGIVFAALLASRLRSPQGE